MTTLTKAVKKQLVIQMVCKAARKKEVSAGIVAENISKELVTLIMAIAKGHVPELPVERWADLVENEVVYPRLKQIQFFPVGKTEGVNVGQMTLFNSDKKKPHYMEILQIFQHAWPKFMSHLTVDHESDAYRIHWQTRFKGVPHIPSTYFIFPAEHDLYSNTVMNNEGLKILNRIIAAMVMFETTFHDAVDLYMDLEYILSSIRTVKQLGEKFPEAVQFLPEDFLEEAKKVTKKIPSTDLIKSAKKRVLEGIPN